MIINSTQTDDLPLNFGTAKLMNQLPPAEGFKKIIIMGSGRTGTTAVTAVFQALGFFAGSTNPSMENKNFDTLLSSNKYPEVLKQFTDMAEQHGRVVWKSTKLISFEHTDFVASLPSDIAVVFVFRDILATAVRREIVHSGGIIKELRESAKGNQRLLRAIEANSNNQLFISYEKLMTATKEVVDAVADFCGNIDSRLLESAINSVTLTPVEYLKTTKEFMDKQSSENKEDSA